MLYRIFKPLLVLALLFALLLPGAQTALAAPPVPSSPEKPLAYTDKWVDIKPGDWQWYAFKYHYDDSGDTPMQPAQIRFSTNPGEGITLELVNGDQVKAYEQGEKLQNFGAATTVYDTTRFKIKLRDFCRDNPNDPTCDDNNGTIKVTQCENKRDPTNTDSTCNYSVTESRGYATWAGTIGASVAEGSKPATCSRLSRRSLRFSINRKCASLSAVTKLTAVPLSPARPVRPMRCV